MARKGKSSRWADQICLFYLKGRCQRAKCEFQHPGVDTTGGPAGGLKNGPGGKTSAENSSRGARSLTGDASSPADVLPLKKQKEDLSFHLAKTEVKQELPDMVDGEYKEETRIDLKIEVDSLLFSSPASLVKSHESRGNPETLKAAAEEAPLFIAPVTCPSPPPAQLPETRGIG